MTKSILFDLDGTLTDSGEGIMKSVVYALAHYGIEAPSEKELRAFVGPPLSESFSRAGVPQDQLTRVVEIYRSRYVPIGMYENTPYPGIEALLIRLRKDGHRLYVATSKPEWMAIDILKHFDLAKYFDLICGATTDFSRNSKSAVIAHLLEEGGAQENPIMVGDTAYDVIGAAAHNIPCIGVSWGYGLVEDMQKAGAAAIADTAQHLYELLNKESV